MYINLERLVSILRLSWARLVLLLISISHHALNKARVSPQKQELCDLPKGQLKSGSICEESIKLIVLMRRKGPELLWFGVGWALETHSLPINQSTGVWLWSVTGLTIVRQILHIDLLFMSAAFSPHPPGTTLWLHGLQLLIISPAMSSLVCVEQKGSCRCLFNSDLRSIWDF